MRTENVEKFVKIGTKQRRPNTFRLFKIPTKGALLLLPRDRGLTRELELEI
jgi:hypothetical protein